MNLQLQLTYVCVHVSLRQLCTPINAHPKSHMYISRSLRQSCTPTNPNHHTVYPSVMQARMYTYACVYVEVLLVDKFRYVCIMQYISLLSHRTRTGDKLCILITMATTLKEPVQRHTHNQIGEYLHEQSVSYASACNRHV